jgi:hypothetical protein
MGETAVSLIGGPRSGTVEYIDDPWPRYGFIQIDDGDGGTALYDPRKVSSSPDVWEAVWVAPGSETIDGEQTTEGEPGPTGPTGPEGPAGPQGPAGEDGAVYQYRGAWSASTPYNEGDVVLYNGSSYVAATGVIGAAPPGAPWGQLAAKGDPGPAGALGPAGPAGAPGPAGPEGPEGPPGDGDGGGLTWRGEWLPDTAYAVDDLVLHPNTGTWVAVADNTNVEPGSEVGPPPTVIEGALLGTVSDVQFHEGDKLASTTYVARSITASSDFHGGLGRPAEPIVIDKSASQTTVLTFNNHSATRRVCVIRYTAAGLELSNTVVAGYSATGTLTLTGPDDQWLAVYFDGGPGATAYGDFDVEVDTAANLIGPPTVATPTVWELLAEPPGEGSGSGGDLHYTHNQSVLAASWPVAHGLGKFPAVDVIDSGGSFLLADVAYIDVNTLTVNFAAPTSGKAYLN